MRVLSLALLAAIVGFSTPALAEFQKVESRVAFLAHVSGKTLIRPLIRIRVTPDGLISGTGVRWDLSGKWQWKSGYLCRSLYWGGNDLGYNCQEVRVNGTTMRITSDRGAGQSADFRLR